MCVCVCTRMCAIRACIGTASVSHIYNDAAEVSTSH